MSRLGFHVDFWKWYLSGLASARKPIDRQKLEELLTHEPTRIAYWLAMREPFALKSGVELSDISLLQKTGYSYDLHKILRPFPRHMRFCAKFGDNFKGKFTPLEPTFVKARGINTGNPNWVLLPLDTHRHFQFPRDHVTWEKKKNLAVWRGAAHRENRKRFIRGAASVACADIGTVIETEGMGPYMKPRMSIAEQQGFKFIISLEGNDVATGLKWIMSSNSLCMMPKPTYETWFMEGTLESGIHYAALAPDGSDLEEKIAYYLDNPHEAQAIIHNAQQYVTPFKNPAWNLLLGQAVAYRYFQLSGQLP